MKYIRTNDGIMKCPNYQVPIYVDIDELDKVADTIEELCDFAYALWEDKTFEVYDLTYDYVKIEDLSKWLAKGDVLEVYYGIKTDKGLIYVAKMNEGGVLELL